MSTVRTILSLIIVSMLLAGCYEAKFPLSSSDGSRIDGRLLKSWVEELQNPGEKPYRAVFFRFSEKEYLVAFSNDNSTATLARAFTTMIGAVPVLNMQGIESEKPADRTFIFFRYAFSSDGSLEARMMSSESPLLEKKKFSTQAAFASYIKKHIQDDRLFGPVRRFKPVRGLGLTFPP